MGTSETLNFTYSGLLNRKGKKVVSVRFERADGRDFADGILPDCADELMEKAKEMSKLTNLL